ncbi:MAG: PAS domain S-box protein [Candidatus Bathyarchaeia archaeon]|jgi:PAS domain S-box-containing protein
MTETSQIRKLKLEIEHLQERLQALEESLASVCQGSADAIVVSTVDGDKVFTLTSEEQSYRVFVEQMLQGAVMLSGDGTVLYCNKAFADMVNDKAETIVGKRIQNFFAQNQLGILNSVLEKNRQQKTSQQQTLTLKTKEDGSMVDALVSFCSFEQNDFKGACLVFIKMPLNF